MEREENIKEKITKSESEQTIDTTTDLVREQLKTAIINGQLEEVKKILDTHPTLPINQLDNSGFTYLHYAARGLWGNQFVEPGQPNKKTLRRNSVVKLSTSNYVEIARLLLSKDADPTIVNNQGMTPLLLAVETGRDVALIDVIRNSNSSLIGVTDNLGNTILHYALASDINTFEVVNCLLSHASHLINRPNYYGVYALHNLIAKRTIVARFEIAELCFKQGAIPTCVNENLESLLHYVAQGKLNNEILVKLLMRQIKKRVKNLPSNNTPEEIRKAFYKEINTRDLYGETPLHKVIKSLLKLNDHLLTKALRTATSLLKERKVTQLTLTRGISSFFPEIMLKSEEEKLADQAPPLKKKDYNLLQQNKNDLITEDGITELATAKKIVIYMLEKGCDPAIIDIYSVTTFSLVKPYPKLNALFQPYAIAPNVIPVPDPIKLDPEIRGIISIEYEFELLYKKLVAMVDKLSQSLVAPEEHKFLKDIQHSLKLYKDFEKLYDPLREGAMIQDYIGEKGEKIERIIMPLITLAKEKCHFYQDKLNYYIKTLMKLSEHLHNIDNYALDFRQSLVKEIERFKFLEKFCFYEKKFFGLIFSIAYHAPNMNYWVKILSQRFQQIKDLENEKIKNHFDKEENEERKADEKFAYPLLIIKVKLLLQHPNIETQVKASPTKLEALSLLKKKLAENPPMSKESYNFFKQELEIWQNYLTSNSDNRDAYSIQAMIGRGMSITQAPVSDDNSNSNTVNQNFSP